MGFYAHNTGVLRPEKPKHRTSLHKSAVLLPRKFRCFAQRTPMFLPFQTPIFPAFCPIWGSFPGRLACEMPKFLFPKPNDLIYTYGKTSKFATFSALEAMPDAVKIFEGFLRFLTLRFRRIPDIETGQCAIIPRMFQPHFPSPAGHDIHHPPATWTEAQPCSTIRAALCRGFQGKMS